MVPLLTYVLFGKNLKKMKGDNMRNFNHKDYKTYICAGTNADGSIDSIDLDSISSGPIALQGFLLSGIISLFIEELKRRDKYTNEQIMEITQAMLDDAVEFSLKEKAVKP